MSRSNQSAIDQAAQRSLADYYNCFTSAVLLHPADMLSIHYGLWGPDTNTDKEALIRANETLVRGCAMHPGRRVLDAGCGLGGTSIWLAQEYGVHAVGLTNCEPHVALAAEQAEKRGVGHLVEFLYGDFMEMPFPDTSFDFVLNHETYCYATDKPAYLREVYRVLKPGGRWQALEGLLTDRKLTKEDLSVRLATEEGWRTLPLQPYPETIAMLEQANFEQPETFDLFDEIMPASRKLCTLWQVLGDLFTPKESAWAYDGFKQAILGFDQGLKRGIFTYRLIVGSKAAN